MRRPLFWIGLVFLSSMAAFLSFPPLAAAALSALAAVSAAFLAPRALSRRALLLFLCCAAAGGLWYTALSQLRACYMSAARPPEGQTAYLRATVTECRAVAGWQPLTVRADITANGATRTAEIALGGYFEDIPQTGDVIFCAASFDGKRYSIEERFEAAAVPHPLLSASIALQRALSDRLYSLFGPEGGGVICALLTGDRSRLPDDTVSDFRKSSLSHLLVVSGMHLIIISHSLSLILSRFLKRRAAAALSLCFCWGFAAMSGFGVSVVRAAVVLTIMGLGELAGRRGDALTSLAAAAMAIALPKPEVLTSASFLLSFSAAAGLSLLQKPICSALCGEGDCAAVKYAAESASSAAAAQLATAPACAVLFGSVPLLGVFANLAAVWLLQPVMALGVLSFALGSLHPVMAAPLVFICQRLIALLLFIARLFASVPFSSLCFSERWQLVWLFCSAVLLAALCCRFGFKGAGRLAAFGISAVYAAAALFSFVCGMGQADILIFEESGCAAVIKGGHAVLLGSPGDRWQRYDVENAFSALGVERLDAVILPDSSAAGYGVAALAKAYGCKALACQNDRRAAAFCHSAGMELCGYPQNSLLFGGIRLSAGQNGFTLAFNEGRLLKNGDSYDIIGLYSLPLPVEGALRLRAAI